MDNLCYIQEQTSYPEDYTNFGYKIVEEKDRFYLIFEGVLQSFGVTNRNMREYIADNIMDCINNDEEIQTMLSLNSWMGEMDHPSADKNGETLTLQRIRKPDLGNTSHYIRSPKLNGNLLEATIQTDSSTEAGRNMAIKIVDGKIVPGFSARVLGSSTNKNGKTIVIVKKLITYDWVIYQSHREALGKLNQPLQESVSTVENQIGCKIIPFPELAKMASGAEDVKFLCEAFELTENDLYGVTETGNSVVYTENTNVYVQPLNDRNIQRKVRSSLRDVFMG